MANTIWVQALTRDRKVLVSEYDEQHPTPNHEIFIVGYEDPRFDADGKEIVPANPPIEVGDTGLVRQRIAEKVLMQVNAPMARQAAQTKKEREAAEKAESERLAAQGGQTPPAT